MRVCCLCNRPLLSEVKQYAMNIITFAMNISLLVTRPKSDAHAMNIIITQNCCRSNTKFCAHGRH